MGGPEAGDANVTCERHMQRNPLCDQLRTIEYQ